MSAQLQTITPEGFNTCPLPKTQYDRILLGHGSGGSLTAQLIQKVFLPGFDDKILAAMEDQATVRLDGAQNGAKGQRIAFTTDSFVVRPLFFPGGDIGTLAVHGTVNDLAVGGAKPLFLSAAFILEEGLPMDDLTRVVASMRRACDEAGVTLVTGDTKVVDRGKAILRLHSKRGNEYAGFLGDSEVGAALGFEPGSRRVGARWMSSPPPVLELRSIGKRGLEYCCSIPATKFAANSGSGVQIGSGAIQRNGRKDMQA
jgi:hypothetical protein